MEQQQIFNLTSLTGPEVEAIMVALNELPAKQSRTLMNKLESQIIQQVRAQQDAQQRARDEMQDRTAAEAVALVRQQLDRMESKLDRFVKKARA